MIVLMGVIVFAASLCYDLSSTRYLAAVTERNAAKAARWSVITSLIGLVGIAGILRYSTWLVIPELIGVWIGTFVGVRLSVKDDSDSN